ncbi:class I adenylate-forming enzyme family protein [Serinibacter salmoneus]|uniref:Fatty-acyl-CoA synthase n=1 Tax=Serinibacter salmoneus TaxID=556530 RepID=A0A2A9D2I7_9MICO|nr:AMP-binding protein [Serinibacter salmoneus]PFG20884.1 fatty-acyl-CoA synthase [Serinibacter salmoneus]
MTARHVVGPWLSASAERDPHRIAIDDRGVTVTYGELEERSAALAQRLQQAGYGPGHLIASVAVSSADHVVLFFACARLGAALVPISWRLTPREATGLLETARPALLVSDEAFTTLATEAREAMSAPRPPHAHLGSQGIEAHVPAAAHPRPAREVRDEDALLVIFTSGTQARPRGVVLTHENCFWTNLALAGAMPLGQEDVVLSILPQFHVAAWNVQPLLAWWRGATVVIEPTFQPRRVLQLIAQRRVTAVMGVPTQYAALAGHRDWAETDLSSLRTVLVGGASTPAATREAWAERGAPLVQGYGLTEAGPNVLSLPAAAGREYAGSVGRPYPHVSVRLTDPASGVEVLGAGTGELWVSGPGVSPGYLHDPEATAAARDGQWLRTGDLVRRDATGVYWVVDRLKDIYISGGENVAPAEVEHALELHPLVARAAVVGVPDATWGERGVAFVVPAAGAALTADEVLAHARDHLAAFKVPARVAVVASLPRGALDKVARNRLRERAVALAGDQQTGGPA